MRSSSKALIALAVCLLVARMLVVKVLWSSEQRFEAEYEGVQAATTGLFTYESPLPPSWQHISDKSKRRWSKLPAGVIDFREAAQLALWKELVAADYLAEAGATALCTDVGNMYPNLDRVFLYAFLRHAKPTRLIEIGSGESTTVAAAALKANGNVKRSTGKAAEHTCIEPYRANEVPAGPKVEQTEMQELSMSFFDVLQAGDVLFIDSSHVSRPFGDTLTELLYVLPRLSTGVLVHIHDIFLPYGYAGIYSTHRQEYIYTEQQSLALMLSGGSRDWEVVFGTFQMNKEHPEEILKMPHYPKQKPNGGSLWIRKIGKPIRNVE
jgi:hypothetical protein